MKKYISLILIFGFLLIITTSLSVVEAKESINLEVDTDYIFGRGTYEDAHSNSFNTDLTGYKVTGSVEILSSIILRGNY